MSEQEKPSYMMQLDQWVEANVIEPLAEAANRQFPQELVDQIKKVFRGKMLQSYRNGQAAGPRPSGFRKPELATLPDSRRREVDKNMWTNSSAAVQMQDRPQGYFRNPDQDGDLLSKFGLSWWTEVDPVLDDEGRLSPRQAERLLMRLKEHEYIFDLALAKMPADEQEHQRSRYSLLKRFITQAISENTPIHTMM